ncbi:MAG: type II toxin-antitoxin system YafQ family toxin [Patescibacteria group bacterium]
MLLKYTKIFLKNYTKRISPNASLVKRFEERLHLFIKNPTDPVLKNHKLLGAKHNLRSFSVTGDIRVVYLRKDKTVYLIDIGTHAQVY